MYVLSDPFILIDVPSFAVCFPVILKVWFSWLCYSRYFVLCLNLIKDHFLVSLMFLSSVVWTLLLLATQPALTVNSLLDQDGTTDWQQTKPGLTDVYVV